MANEIKEKWDALFYESSVVDHNLGGIKKTFTKVTFVINLEEIQKWKGKPFKDLSLQITQQQVEDFSKEIEDFFHKFVTQGPGSVGEDLDKGKSINV